MLHELKKSTGTQTKALRRGRGNGTGRGNYSTRGLKGQKARSGFSRSAGFEGGQTTLHMRLPKLKGFKRYFKNVTTVIPINIGALNDDKAILDKDTITAEKLVELGYGKSSDSFKILGSGELTKVVNIQAIATSQAAKTAIEKAGGTITD